MYTKPNLTATADLPDSFENPYAAIAEWPKILSDCKIVGQYLDRIQRLPYGGEPSRDEFDIPAANVVLRDISVAGIDNPRVTSRWRKALPWLREQLNDPIIDEKNYGFAWTILIDTSLTDPEEPFKVVDGKETLQPRDKQETRWAIGRMGLLRLRSDTVSEFDSCPFGEEFKDVIKIAVPNLRSGHETDDKRAIERYLYEDGREQSYTQLRSSNRINAYQSALVLYDRGRIVNANLESPAPMLTALREFHASLK